MRQSSGVGVLDKAVRVLEVIEGGPIGLTELVARTGLSRATAHRLALALKTHRLLGRDPAGRFTLGPRLAELAAAAASGDGLVAVAPPILARLRDATGESAQLYVRRGEERVCVAAAERGSGLRDTVPVGAVLPMTAGSAAQVLLAEEPTPALVARARFSPRRLAEVRRRGWADSAAEREAGVASVSAPVRGPDGQLAAISVSGPLERLGRYPGRSHADAVVRAAGELAAALSGSGRDGGRSALDRDDGQVRPT